VVTENPQQKILLIFFRSSTGSEPVREWLKELPVVEQPRHWHGPVAGTMALADRHAPLPSYGMWLVGNPNRPAYEANSSRAALSLPGTPRRIA
jgi:hypothetical protein